MYHFRIIKLQKSSCFVFVLFVSKLSGGQATLSSDHRLLIIKLIKYILLKNMVYSIRHIRGFDLKVRKLYMQMEIKAKTHHTKQLSSASDPLKTKSLSEKFPTLD